MKSSIAVVTFMLVSGSAFAQTGAGISGALSPCRYAPGIPSSNPSYAYYMSWISATPPSQQTRDINLISCSHLWIMSVPAGFTGPLPTTPLSGGTSCLALPNCTGSANPMATSGPLGESIVDTTSGVNYCCQLNADSAPPAWSCAPDELELPFPYTPGMEPTPTSAAWISVFSTPFGYPSANSCPGTFLPSASVEYYFGGVGPQYSQGGCCIKESKERNTRRLETRDGEGSKFVHPDTLHAMSLIVQRVRATQKP